MKILLTGGAGFIGSHVAETYLRAGHQVIVLDNLSSGKLENLPDGVKFYLLDITSKEVERVMEIEKPDIVNHHAAQISVTVSARDPITDARINALGLLNVLNAASKSGVKKFIFISSGGAIYGEADVMPTPETYPPQPLSPYGIHKFLGENYLRFFNEEYGLKSISLRYANVYGPRQDPFGEAGVVAIFINRLLRGEKATIYAYPDEPEGMTRDYVYVKDVARANLMALEKGENTVVNIGTGKETKTRALYDEIASIIGTNLEPEKGKARPGDLRASCLDNSRAREMLSWEPGVNLKKGLKETVDFFKKSL